jgi:hypothetical protein
MCSLILPSHVGIGLQDALGKLFFFPIFPFFEAFLLFIFLFFFLTPHVVDGLQGAMGKLFFFFICSFCFPNHLMSALGYMTGWAKAFLLLPFFTPGAYTGPCSSSGCTFLPPLGEPA